MGKEIKQKVLFSSIVTCSENKLLNGFAGGRYSSHELQPAMRVNHSTITKGMLILLWSFSELPTSKFLQELLNIPDRKASDMSEQYILMILILIANLEFYVDQKIPFVQFFFSFSCNVQTQQNCLVHRITKGSAQISYKPAEGTPQLNCRLQLKTISLMGLSAEGMFSLIAASNELLRLFEE